MDKFFNHPPHCYLDDFYYFITSHTVRDNIFDSDYKKGFIYFSIIKALKKYNYTCQSWVILENHYQLVVKSRKGEDLGKFVRYINGRSANLLLHDSPHFIAEKEPTLNGHLKNFILDSCQQDGENHGVPDYYNKVWYQYWDTPLETTEDIWGCINYSHVNPIKHGLVKDLFSLDKYKWSSYNAYLEKYGLEFMIECFEKFKFDV